MGYILPSVALAGRRMTKKKVIKRKGGKRGKRPRAKLPVSAVRVRGAALVHDTIAEAAAALDVDPPLDQCLTAHPALQDAWERGQFLRRLGELASVPATVSEAAKDLGIDPRELRRLLDTDRIARDLWDERRFRLRIEGKRALVELVKGGQVSATGIARIERVLNENLGIEPQKAPGTDLTRVPQKDLVDLLGVSRVTLHDWYLNKGLPRNGDGSYNLRDVVPWWRRYIEDKIITSGPKVSLPGGETPTQRIKRRRIELEVAEVEGRLWRREDVIDHWIGLAQIAANTLSRQTAIEHGHQLAGRTAEEVTRALEKLFARLRRDLASPPRTVILPEAVRPLYTELVATLQTIEKESEG